MWVWVFDIFDQDCRDSGISSCVIANDGVSIDIGGSSSNSEKECRINGIHLRDSLKESL